MKQIVVIVMILSGIEARAQKGSWYLGGSLGLSSFSRESEIAGMAEQRIETFSWMVAPEIGTFITNHFQLGLGLTLAGSTQSDAFQGTSVVNKTIGTYWGVSLHGRYFFGNGAFRPFAGINAFVLSGNSKGTTTSVSPAKHMNYGANLNAGFAYMITSRLTAIGSIGALGFRRMTSTQNNPTRKESSTYFGLDSGTPGNRFNLGIYYTFIRKVPSPPQVHI